MKRVHLFILLAIVLVCVPILVWAQMFRAPYVIACARSSDIAIGILVDDYKEEMVFIGSSNAEDKAFLLYHNDRTGTFTMVIADPATGHTCYIASGKDLRLVKKHNYDPERYRLSGEELEL